MTQPFLIGGEWRTSNGVLEVRFPYDGSLIDSVYLASHLDMQDAVDRAERGFALTRRLPAYRRSDVPRNLTRLLEQHFDQMVDLLIVESGKDRKTAVVETKRAIQTICISAEEALRIGGEVFSIDWTPAGENCQGFTRRMPVGIVLGIAPFNYPLNLACHKLGPAIAAGNAIILKPAEKTPLTALLLGRLTLEAGYPPEALSVINAYGVDTEPMLRDPRINMVSFTGSAAVGWRLKERAGRKKVTLELGGNAGVIVCEDAPFSLAVTQSVSGAFANAGQNCISVQRVFVHQTHYEAFVHAVLTHVQALKVGDPRDPETDVGCLITSAAAERTEAWVQEAVREGATILAGSKRDGTLFQPTVLTNTTPTMRVNCEEVFAPVVTISPYQTWDEAVERINEGEYGLQAGVFTQSMARILDAWERIDVAGLQINRAPTFRVDHMPYGGIKNSGFGREGVKYAIEDMTELRLMVVAREPQH